MIHGKLRLITLFICMSFKKNMVKIFHNYTNKILCSVAVIIFLAFSFLIFYRLGIHPFIDWDESIYAQVAKESLLNKQFFSFTYFGEPWYEKPPLVIWLVSFSFSLGIPVEWAARIPSALAAILTVALSLWWIWELRKSYYSLIIVASSYFIMFPFITGSYFLNFDTIVGFFVLLAVYSGWKIIECKTINPKWFIVCGVAIGLGVMAKNVVGFFPLIPLGIYTLLQGRTQILKLLKSRNFWLGVLMAVLIILPWHLYQSIVNGLEFWNNYFLYHVFQRYTTGLENNDWPFLYYFNNVFLRYALSTVVFGGSLIISLWIAFRDQSMRLILLSFIILFLIFSGSSTKLASYIVVTLPLLVILSGISFDWILQFLTKQWLKIIIVLILSLSFIYNGFAFNTYKLAMGEYSEETLNNRAVGIFLNNYRRDLPVYINVPYKNLAIGFYAQRPIVTTIDNASIDNAKQKVFHKSTEEVFLGQQEGREYLMIIR